MRFATVSAAVVTFAVSALAQIEGFDPITSPADGQKVAAGSKLSIKWQPGDVKGAVKIALIGGATQNTQQPLTTISSGVDNQAGAFEWTVPETLGDKAVYGLTITLESDPKTFQYSFPFHISPVEGGASTAAATTEAATGGYKASSAPVVTVSLSSAASTAAASSTAAYAVSSAPAVSSSKAVVPATSSAPAATYPTVAPAGNSSASYSAGVPTTLASYPATNSSKPTGAPSPIPTAGASRLATGSFLGAGAMALYFFL
ncbi:hypothetical protein PG993_001980 [Apiospora rasikravindrae]|uniref:Yeast cell wall synthesis Kre9/Knh1-like N-terminal domain-containing protein n=1 Tax=Apiospora rasikravindrae TaxID=990691 RepID=A0ABR1UCY2_9PEZI